MFKNSLGKKNLTPTSLLAILPDLQSRSSLFWCSHIAVTRRYELGSCLWSHLGNEELFQEGLQLSDMFAFFLYPLVWRQHDPKRSGGVWWRATETSPREYRNFIVVALGGAAANTPSSSEEPASFFPGLHGYIPVLLLPLLAETPRCGPLEKLIFMLMDGYETRTKKIKDHALAI